VPNGHLQSDSSTPFVPQSRGKHIRRMFHARPAAGNVGAHRAAPRTPGANGRVARAKRSLPVKHRHCRPRFVVAAQPTCRAGRAERNPPPACHSCGSRNPALARLRLPLDQSPSVPLWQRGRRQKCRGPSALCTPRGRVRRQEASSVSPLQPVTHDNGWHGRSAACP
jgi:hypothetical protein